MKVTDYLQKAFLKPIVAGLCAGAINHLVLKEPVQKSVIFGAATSAGIFSVSWVSPIIAEYVIPTKTGLAGISSSLEMRVVETVLGGASVFIVDKYLLKNNTVIGTAATMMMVKKIGIIAVSDIAAETFIMMV